MASPRRVLGLTIPDLAVLAAYAAVLCLAIPHYLPWEDEGRAWTAVRYFGLYDLVFHFLRYEGHPPIWYLLLWPLARLHLSYLYINWVSGACALTGIYFLLRFSPFPRAIRTFLPFGFALAYEYAVVARSYCLFPLFGFLVAHEYRQPTRRPIRMAVCLAMLANLSFHGTIIAAAFAMPYAWDLYREHRVAAEPTWSLPQARLAAGIFAASLVFVAIVLWPAHDLQAPLSPELSHAMHRIAPAEYHPAVHPARLLRIAAVQTAPALTQPRPLALNLGMGSLKIRDRLRTVFVYPIATSALLAILFEALVVALAWRRGKPLLAAAPLLLGVFIVEVYLRLWHTSLIWVALIMILWVVWDENESFARPSLQNVTLVVFTLICVLQVRWTSAALRFERTHATYPAKAAATYLKALPPNSRIDGFDHAFTVLPYFSIYPFHLENDALDVPTVVADHPDAILYRDSTVTDLQLDQLRQAGYADSHSFCGTPFFPNQQLVPLCLVVLQKTGGSPS